MSTSKEELKKILPKNGPNIDEVSKYIEKYKDEIITIKYGGNVFIDRQIFNNFINGPITFLTFTSTDEAALYA